MQTQTASKPMPVPMNGVDTPKLLATINAVGAQPELAKFQFRAENKWIAGTHSVSTISAFNGAGGAHQHGSMFTAHMQVPLWSTHPLPAGRIRTADLFPTMLRWLGEPLPENLDGELVWDPARPLYRNPVTLEREQR